MILSWSWGEALNVNGGWELATINPMKLHGPFEFTAPSLTRRRRDENGAVLLHFVYFVVGDRCGKSRLIGLLVGAGRTNARVKGFRVKRFVR